MINIAYASINSITEANVLYLLSLLPDFMKTEVLRYVNINDQKRSLLARVILIKILREEGFGHYITRWSRDKYNKPYIEGWKHFNISHSSEMVILAHGNIEVGVDIEKIEEYEIYSLVENLHDEEQVHILNSTNKRLAFYNIWVKKEAVLKAMGTGFHIDIKKINCVGSYTSMNEKKWYFHPIELGADYVSYYCTYFSDNMSYMREIKQF